jgi:hypothetical protein
MFLAASITHEYLNMYYLNYPPLQDRQEDEEPKVEAATYDAIALEIVPNFAFDSSKKTHSDQDTAKPSFSCSSYNC